MESVNEELIALYRSYWDDLVFHASRFSDEAAKPACPLLLQVNDAEYRKADVRVMFVGQETWGWGSLFKNTLEERLNRYRNYYLERGYLKDSRSAFWKGVRRFEKFLTKRFEGRKIVSAWNNVSKIGLQGRRGVSEPLRTFEREFFPVFRREVEILSPDLIVFMTGPNRDRDIRFHFPEAIVGQTNEEKTARELATVDLGAACRASIRTYHPSYYGGFNRSFEDATSALMYKVNEWK